MQMASELRTQILKADDIGTEPLDVPEWNVKLEIRGMNGKARAKSMRAASAGPEGAADFEQFFADLIIASSFDPETGEQVFDPADRDAINSKSGAAINRISEIAMRLSGLTDAAVKQAEADLGEIPKDAST